MQLKAQIYQTYNKWKNKDLIEDFFGANKWVKQNIKMQTIWSIHEIESK